jgi:hypothetical protein
VVTVDGDVRVVERRLAAGRLRCPGCPGRLAGWGHARPRVIRGEYGIGWLLRPAAIAVPEVRGHACAAAGDDPYLFPAPETLCAPSQEKRLLSQLRQDRECHSSGTFRRVRYWV